MSTEAGEAHTVDLLHRAEEKLAEVKQLRADAEREASALASSAIGSQLRTYKPAGKLEAVLLQKPRNGWSAPCDNAEGGVAVLSLGAVTGFNYRPTEFKRTSEPTAEGAHYWLAPGDLLMTRSNTEKLVGHAAIYTGEPYPCIYPDLMMKLSIDPSKADTRFVYYWLRTPEVRALIEDAGRGTSSTMKKITQKHVMDLPFPVGLDLDEQRRAVRILDGTPSKVDDLVHLQTEATRDLDALLPSLIDRAFETDHDRAPAVTVA